IVGFILLSCLSPAWAQHVSTPAIFASGVPGPEGLAFERHGSLVVGSAIGQIFRYHADGSSQLVGDLAEPPGGLTVLKDGRILAAAFAPGRVWSIDPVTGTPTVFATGVAGANYIVQTRLGRILVSASTDGKIYDITNGTPVERASGLSFPNGLAL